MPEDGPFRTETLVCSIERVISRTSPQLPETYTNLLRAYACLLDEGIDCLLIGSTETDEEKIPERFPDKMKELGRMIEVLPQLLSLIDRVMDCWPTWAIAKNFIVQSSMKHIITIPLYVTQF